MSNPFQTVSSGILKTKSVDQLLSGNNSKYIGEGTYDVKIKAVDSSNVTEKSYIIVEYEAADSRTCKDFIFLLNYDKNGFSKQFINLYAALFTCADLDKTKDAVVRFINEAGKNSEACNIFTGMQLKITNKKETSEKTFDVRSNGEGHYVALSTEDGSVLAGPCETAKEVRELAEGKGFDSARIRTIERSATDGESNIKILDTALSPKSAPKAAIGGPKGPKII